MNPTKEQAFKKINAVSLTPGTGLMSWFMSCSG
jgi:hypothetical protein